MPTLFEAGVNIIIFLILLSILQALLGVFGLVGGGVSIHDTHVVNTVRPLHPEVSDEDNPLQLYLVLRMEPFEFLLTSMHGATCVYFGVVTHVRWGEGLARKVGDPITEIVVTRRDEASLLAVKGVAYFK